MNRASHLLRLPKIFRAIFFFLLFNVFITTGATAAVIDIMLVYDTTGKTWADNNGGMAAFSAQSVNKMNQALQNSGISHSFRLVHSYYLSGHTSSGNLSNDYYALRDGTGVFAGVHSARNTYGADIVAMLINTGSPYGYVGIGSLMTSFSGSVNACWSVNSIQSVDISHTLTHEVGHNLGAHHARNQKSDPGPNGYLDNLYSAGYYFTGTNSTDYHTIMAYNSDGYGNSYTRAPLFSNPSKYHQGTAAGRVDYADNTRLLKQTMPTVATYRSSTTTVTLTGLAISGPTTVDENSSATYNATASWSDGSTTTVTPSWSENSSATTINSSGVLTTSSVSSNQSVTITASYTSGGVTETDTHNVTVRNVAATLTGLTINGPTTVDENSTASYTATASWSDGNTTTVTPSWSENSSVTTINSSGVLTTSSVSSNQSLTITASYSSGGVTETDTHNITVRNVPPTLTGLTISGPTTVDEESSATYTATASWSDGNTTTVTPSWSENSSATTINSSGVLTTSSVSSNRSVTITASYSSGGVTETDTHNITVRNVPPTLTGLTISGPTTVDEESSATYTATASWSDGSTTTVTPSWSENSSATTINSSGVLTTGSVSSNQSVTITASYTSGGVTETDSHGVTVRNLVATLTGLTISGPTTVDENSSATYTATANWSDGSNTTVSPSWSENSTATTISASGVFTVSSIDSNESVTISASYSAGGHTQTDTHVVTIVAATLTGLTINGPTNISENSTVLFTATAAWSDGSTTTVNPEWSENSAHTDISGTGILTSGNVTSDQSAVISASYTINGVTQTDSHNVTIRNITANLVRLSIDGPASVEENGSATYIAYAHWDDGSSTAITPKWSDNSASANIDATGLLTVASIGNDQEIEIQAVYSHNTITRSEKMVITLLDTEANGPDFQWLLYNHLTQAPFIRGE